MGAPKQWLQPDVIECGRALITGLSYAASNRAREIHVLRLRNAFDRAGFAHSLRYVLSVLTLMREIQELKGGYWFPTPPRIVPLTTGAILVAPTDTRELQRHFPAVRRAGYARVLPQISDFDLPKQALSDWAEFEVANTEAWAGDLLRQARESMGPTIESQNIEFFSLQRTSELFGKCTKPTWTRDFRCSACTNDKIVLCRAQLAERHYRYFLGQVEAGKLIAEAAVSGDANRLQYGIAALTGRPITVVRASEESSGLMRIFAVLPRPERRLLLALGVRSTSGSGKAYRLQNEAHMDLITDTLQRLGCEIKKTHA